MFRLSRGSLFAPNDGTGASSPADDEEGRTMLEIKALENKIRQAWDNFSFAKPEYIEIAVLELKLAEAEHCLLNRKLKMMRGEPMSELKIHILFPWLKQYIKGKDEDTHPSPHLLTSSYL
ncbi:Hypothetical protein DEACI_1016 [Acididesulfobacillus acetoxydans]|uniref:Uncharacterized protein n=1 Tax=Acididesulfobacillus acetoxydans TaxID=1561005 RepID=A0A8S0VW31_9FIRM|nr:hypothetical protein [Acididesulfobacillus acetoxydans]CAA7600363.1 Hypothetical protein DEACI_1016 [Acididesulfobacillus acetoxydans]CEJ07885.1 Hypothetical protein DEACI_2353 [Acididesulfobacillus acetoxydans]